MELPDFEELAGKVESITALSLREATLEYEIKKAEANVYILAVNTTDYYQGGKPPSATYIENTYKFTGLAGEILPLRKELIEISSLLEKEKSLFYLLKTRIEIWRSEQANQRGAVLY